MTDHQHFGDGRQCRDFAQTNTCGGPVAANCGTCTINVTFTPAGILGRTASISIADNANGSPQNVTLTGAGGAPIAGITTTSLTFSSQNLGTTSAAQTFTMLLEGARVSQPQLVQLYDALDVRPDQPFRDVSEARSWIEGEKT